MGRQSHLVLLVDNVEASCVHPHQHWQLRVMAELPRELHDGGGGKDRKIHNWLSSLQSLKKENLYQTIPGLTPRQ